jgi:hypothetical protein
MRRDLSQQPTLDEKPQIVVDRGQRNRWNATANRSIDVLRGMVSVGSDHGLIDHLTLVRDCQTVLRGQFPELFMGETHNYRIRISINDGQGCPPKSFHLEPAEQRADCASDRTHAVNSLSGPGSKMDVGLILTENE